MARIRASTSANSALVTRSVLLRTMTSANAIWFLASGASLSRALSHFASATVTTASSRAFLCTSSSTKKVCATGAGDQIVVNADLAEFIDDDSVFLAVVFRQDAVQERSLAGAEIARQHGHGNFWGGQFWHNHSGN